MLLLAGIVGVMYTGGWEYSVRRYLKGFSDALVPETASPEQKTEAILTWMRNGPPRLMARDVSGLSTRDPETTLNYQQLLAVCGTATNAFLNLARSAGLSTRRLLLLTPERSTKHVVAEVLIDGRWVIVDPTFRIMLRGTDGHLLTRQELQNPAMFVQATSVVPNYPGEYNYEHFAHVRVGRIPWGSGVLRRSLDRVFPGWDEKLDWSLLLERESFFALFVACIASGLLLILRIAIGWYADRRLNIPRFRLREQVARASAVFFSTSETK